MDTERVQALNTLRTLVEGEKDLYVGNPVDENVLLQYLNYANFNVDKAFEKMKVVYRLKLQNNEWYAHRRDPAVHDVILRKGVHVMLDNRDQLGRRVYFLRLGNLVYGAHEPHEMFQVDDLWLSLAIDEEETQRNGLVFVFDMEGMPWKFLRYFTPHIVRITTTKAENIPINNIQYHVVNPGLLLHTVIQLVFPFLSQATKELVFFHKKVESLHEHISPSILPAEYGGEKPPLDPASLVTKYLDARNNRMAELLSYGYKIDK